MKRQRFSTKSISIEALRTTNGRHYIVWVANVSMYFTDAKAMLRWIKWPKGTPTRDEIETWLNQLDAAPQPAAPEEGLSEEHRKTGFVL